MATPAESRFLIVRKLVPIQAHARANPVSRAMASCSRRLLAASSPRRLSALASTSRRYAANDGVAASTSGLFGRDLGAPIAERLAHVAGGALHHRDEIAVGGGRGDRHDRPPAVGVGHAKHME